ncbi:MAG: glycosyltransferase family 2 protein [Turneriella sp.]|nr:glycosyltransferase family 2 protein [Turneriella sp.]
MRQKKPHPRIAVVIPALNEEKSIALVIADLQKTAQKEKLPLKIIVSDNGSSDRTALIARHAGAVVVHEPQRGYGAACLRALQDVPAATEVVLFIDADYSDYPQEFPRLVRPILQGELDFVLGSRTMPGKVRERGALTPQQRFGNWLATRLIALLFGMRFSDLGPFRAIRKTALEKLQMDDRNFGWTVQMQVRAVRAGLRIREIPVSYRRRIGKSKISGTLSGTIRAGWIILRTIWREWRHNCSTK